MQTITPGAVVVGYSGERDVEHTLIWAAEQADLENRPLALVHVLEPIGGFGMSSLASAYTVLENVTDAAVQGGRALLAAGSAIVWERFPDVDVEIYLFNGTPDRVLTELGEHAALVVVGSRRRGRLASALLGSVSVTVANNAACPVVVVKPPRTGKARNGILVGTDCTRESHATLEFAYRQASLRQLPLTVLYSVDGLEIDQALDTVQGTDSRYADHRRELAEAVAGMGEKFPDVQVQTVLGSANPDRQLISESESMDLVVVGHHHRAGLVDRFAIGSYAPVVVEQAACPVAVVFEAPASFEVPASS